MQPETALRNTETQRTEAGLKGITLLHDKYICDTRHLRYQADRPFTVLALFSPIESSDELKQRLHG